jgi:hypothetical protein
LNFDLKLCSYINLILANTFSWLRKRYYTPSFLIKILKNFLKERSKSPSAFPLPLISQ